MRLIEPLQRTDHETGAAVVLSERDADVDEHDDVGDEDGDGVRLRLPRDLVLDRPLRVVGDVHVRVLIAGHVVQEAAERAPSGTSCSSRQ